MCFHLKTLRNQLFSFKKNTYVNWMFIDSHIFFGFHWISSNVDLFSSNLIQMRPILIYPAGQPDIRPAGPVLVPVPGRGSGAGKLKTIKFRISIDFHGFA